MAGHSKWANLRRRERVQARKRAECRGQDLGALKSVRYEGYGPGGAAVMVDCLGEDHGRIRAEVRRAFLQHGGQLGADGSVSYLFNTVGLMTYPPGTDEEQLMRVALEAGAEDVVANADRSVEVLADPFEFDTVRAVLTHHGFSPASAEVTQRAATSIELRGESAEHMMQLLEALEGLSEVRDVYSNGEIPDEVLSRI
ncbi:MAG TPA: YebC/PmpR family DNA-binding transcriptional regulator [Steroidobacteraceae bacterium]|jgi:transcriptional/translational regulatory protein YebC/TACO1|nr:YebC/PmpR family DNA-binding transcriptional regulator [Steroidobacteraceae bacterium]